MKRHSALIRYSREHHSALVIAKRAQYAAGNTNDSMVHLASDIAREFECEIKPHFQREECNLLSRLDYKKHHALIEQTLSEHNALCALADRLMAGDVNALNTFGELLVDHVRFEERELFPVIESTFDPLP